MIHVSGDARHTSPAARAASGKAARRAAPLEAHAEFRPGAARDPVGLLLEQAETRVPELVPVRHDRMLASPFAFYRGAALVMAADLSTTPTSGLQAQLCGDAHLSNFGAFATPERRLVFDINDFDETLPGSFEWDVKRLAASLAVAGRDNSFTNKQCRTITLAGVQSYRRTMRVFATQPILDVWYAHLDIEDAVRELKSSRNAPRLKNDRSDLNAADRFVVKARRRDSLQAVGKLTTMNDGQRRIRSDPPLIVPLDEATGFNIDVLIEGMRNLIASYRATLPADRTRLLDHYTLADVAHKVVGVGSVGTRTWILLLESGLVGDALLLQAKQALRPALADYAGPSEHVNQGERVVAGQHLMQAASDIFLGWVHAEPTDGDEADYYLRQLRDWKLSAVIDEMKPRDMLTHARLCGWTLARAHARSGDRIAISAYLGKSTKFDNAIADFAETYADQNERDHAALAVAVETGRTTANGSSTRPPTGRRPG